VAWSNFQKKWPSIAMRYKRDLLGIFQGKYADVEDLESYRTGSDKYSIKFTTWEGTQRIFPGTQIVFQVESPLLSIENGVGHCSNLSIRKSLRTLVMASEHPVTALTVGWLRVHVDDFNRLCFIDEVQSDVMEYLLQLSSEQGNPVADAMSKDFIDWLVHGFVSVQHWAHCIGYRVAMHTRLSAESVGNKTASERKWNVYYGSLIKRFRLVEFDPLGYFAAVFVEPRVPSLANPNSAVQHG
jgi:hypothetical protein